MYPNRVVLLLFCLVTRFQLVFGFTDYLLKTCAQSGFCHRNRAYGSSISESGSKYYSIDLQSVNFDEDDNVMRASIIKRVERPDGNHASVSLPFSLAILSNNSIRFTVDENRPTIENLPQSLSSRRYNETSKWAFDCAETHGAKRPRIKRGWLQSDVYTIASPDKTVKLELHTKSFLMKVFHRGQQALVVNERSFLNFEHYRSKEDNYRHLAPEESSFNMFGDDFQYSQADSLPFGPESVALDITFKHYSNVFGIPEHADSLRLRDTTDRDPYRLFNVDVFEYNLNSTFPTYGSIPLMIASKPESSIGVFWVNAADTWVDIKYDDHDTKTHWMSESGIIDVVLFFGDEPSEITEKYTFLTGRPFLPSLSSLGYHQCRWNYNDELDVLTVDSEMDRAHIPYDNIWLDIEYTDERKFFTWKSDSFPNPSRLLKRLAKLGRQLTVLIDPHLKEDYEVSDSIVRDNVAVKDCKGQTFVGHCWPGQSIWIDTFDPAGQSLWTQFFMRFSKGIANLNIWNDMNEPSIFSGPETTAPKDLLHYNGFEERSVHNLYGLTVHETTYKSMKAISPEENTRPFVLTRSFFSGSQRTAATWTGDNVANWDYLRISIPMCLSNNIAGMPFIGADIAGFSGNPEEELIARWYQAGLWYPFFRAHAHIDTLRREPYLFEEPLKSIVRNAIQLRYTLLPTFYSTFHRASKDGSPILKPMFYQKPQFPELYDVDDQFYVGDSGLLVKPVLERGQRSIHISLAPGIYYHYPSLESLVAQTNIEIKQLDAPLDKIPVLLEGGHIIFSKERYRRSAKLYRNDPYTLTVAPDLLENAAGKIYVDDGETFNFQSGEFLETQVVLQKGKILKNIPLNVPSSHIFIGNRYIEKIILPVGRMTVKELVKVQKGHEIYEVAATREGLNSIAILNPLVRLDEEWVIMF
ncbi:hypothetical protein HG536_0H03560 [Torulaspora globosa]|uniref:Glucosidase II subunit alpha n=1 Tax=Torulaspora globosa TaxID=48254 RepID=A0A7G3ZN94_9SACH|nr:uncharacterized protein HG536_0H03560 [Torulaspora globosa]QLL34980.1 hypothetical protein HG536_0H03560 [Torulaspora globosa]